MYKTSSLVKNISKGVIFLKNRNIKNSKVSDRIKDLLVTQYSDADPNGSYTGVPKNPNEKPIQDVDDL